MQEELKRMVKANLERLMAKKNMTQIDVSEKANIPKQTINGYVKGTSLPTPGNTEKLAKLFNVSKADIDPRFKSETFKDSDLDEAKKQLNGDESEFFELLIEKTLSLGENDRENFLKNIRFAIEFFDKNNK